MQFTNGVQGIEYFTSSSIPFGLTYGRWTIMWWNWVVSIPKTVNPVTDTNGESANLKQKKQTWFLAGCFEGDDLPRRKCTIPQNTSIFFPVVNYESNFYEKPEITKKPELIEDVSNDIDKVIEKKVVVDQIEIPCFRIKSDPGIFLLNLPEDNCLDIKAGVIEASSDGYWVFLKPLCSGKHEIEFHGLCPGGVKLGAHYELIVE
jgi:hypothetical protein